MKITGYHSFYRFIQRFAFILSCALVILAASIMPIYAQVLDKTVAIVKLNSTENISQQQLRKQFSLLEKQTGKKLTEDDKKDVLEAAINEVLILQVASRGKYTVSVTEKQIDDAIASQRQSLGAPISDADYRRWIQSQLGLDWSGYRKKIKGVLIQQQYIANKYKKEIQSVGAPNDSETQKFYEQYATNFTNPALVRLSHLFWDTRKLPDGKTKKDLEKQAYDMAAKINKNSVLFKKYMDASVDDANYAGEDLGYIVRDPHSERILGKDFLDAVFSMNQNNVSGVLESVSGYHIVLVVDKRGPKLLEIDDPILPGEKITVRSRIKDILANNKRQEKLLELIKVEVAALRKKANIKYFFNNL